MKNIVIYVFLTLVSIAFFSWLALMLSAILDDNGNELMSCIQIGLLATITIILVKNEIVKSNKK